MQEFDKATINKLILKKHHLFVGTQIDDILKITNDLCGLHATGTIEPYIQLFIRSKNFQKEDLDTELYTKKTLGKIRGMRKTLFLLTKDLMQIIYPFAKNLTQNREQKYLEYRNISLEEYNVLSEKILELLEQKELSTRELKLAIKSKKDLTAVISVMCDQMLLIRGKPISSWRDRRLLYAPFRSYFPDLNLSKYTESEAIKLLIKKYINSYGPVTENDIKWWSGLIKTKVNTILEELNFQLESIHISGLDYKYFLLSSNLNFLQQSSEPPVINLLPLLDPYMMGYKIRERYLNMSKYNYIFDRTGNATSVIIKNGTVIGIWDIVDKPKPVFKIHLFEKVNENILNLIHSKAKELAMLIKGENLEIELCKTMIALTDRSMGGFMSPLKES